MAFGAADLMDRPKKFDYELYWSTKLIGTV